MKRVPLGGNKYAIVDDQDYKGIILHRWYIAEDGYVAATIKKQKMYLHKFVLNVEGMVDHIDRDKLNFVRTNLRPCTHTENMRNRGLFRNNSSGYKGVSWDKGTKKWRARIDANGKKYHIGYFVQSKDAAKAYDKWATELFGEFAYLNFPTNTTPVLEGASDARIIDDPQDDRGKLPQSHPSTAPPGEW